jgi:hypothetical protein
MRAALGADSGAAPAWTILPVESNQNWGAASTELVRAIMDGPAQAIIALDRDCAHLSEQLALKSFVPVVAISDDRTLTSADVPWIFRLPAATQPATAMRLVVAAARGSSASQSQLRDVLASGRSILGIAFEPNGEPRALLSAAEK